MVSFDIFDTLITRRVATPYGIFAYMQKALAEEKYKEFPAYIRNNFYTLRIHAEELARHHNARRGIEEVILPEIYEAMSMAGELSEVQKEQLCQLECQTELQNVLPIKSNIALLKDFLTKGEKVVLISDMYLPEQTIRQMLQKADKDLAALPLYVSSTLTARKTTGNIYRKVKEAEQEDYGKWIHYGDNQYQDCEIPQKLGINCVQLEKEPLLPIEQKVISVFEDDICTQLLTGQARYTRICISMDAKTETGKQTVKLYESAQRMGSSVCGPILYSYVDWILQDCLKRGVKRLYFIARDGYLLKKIADILIQKYSWQITTKYIYGSRRAWRMCSLSEAHFNLAEILSWSYSARIHSIKQLAEIVELSVEELIPFLPYGAKSPDTEVNQTSLFLIVTGLEQNAGFRKLFLQKQAEKRALAIEYFKQELDVSDEQFAFVDLSGGGLTQGCLAELLSTFCNYPVHSYFFKIDRVNLVKKCHYHVFFPSLIQNNLVVEMLCHAPHGQTYGYEKRDGKIVPLLDNFEEAAFQNHGYAGLEEALCKYTENMAEIENQNQVLRERLKVIKEYLIYVAQTPDEEVLEYFASFPNNETGREKKLLEYAPKLTREDILNIFLRRIYYEDISRYYRGTNLDYSVLRCSAEDKQLVDKCKKEYQSEWGLTERKEKLEADKLQKERFGRAAYFPTELLEEKVVLYGAGKYGCDLYQKISQDSRSRVVQWADSRNGYADYPSAVVSKEEIGKVDYDQIVIGVMKKQVAEEIRQELLNRGIPERKILWVPVSNTPNAYFNWEAAIYQRAVKKSAKEECLDEHSRI